MTADEETAAAARELSWLLSTLDETVGALRSGLEECRHLLAASGPGSTLPLSTSRSEALKGVVTRVGSRVTRGDMQVKMAGLPHTRGLPAYKLSVAVDRTLMLEQLVDVGNYVAASLELLRRAGDGGDAWEDDGEWLRQLDPKSVMQLLSALYGNMMAARTALKGASAHRLFPFHAVDPNAFDPPLPPSVAFDLYITEAAVVAELRTLEPAASPDPSKSAFFDISPFGFRERFAAAVGIHRDTAAADPAGLGGTEPASDQILRYNGADVRVRELVRVESQDPTLMAAWAKLGGLEHVLATTIKSLELVMTAAGIQ